VARARQAFITNLATYRRASQQAALLGSSPPITPSDQSARILRNGLSVAGLALIEEFIRERTGEIMDHINRARLPLTALPLDLRKAATNTAIRNLAWEVRGLIRDNVDPIPLIHETSRALASTQRARSTLSKIALHWAESNVGTAHIGWTLNVLGVDRPWDQVTSLATRSGFAVGPMIDVFGAALRERHSAAHRFDKDSLLLDVRSFPQNALAFAIGFDSLACRAAVLCATQDPAYLGGRRVTAADITFRFLDDIGAGHAEVPEGGTPLAIHATLPAARSTALRRAPTSGDVIVQRDRNGVPVWWQSGDMK
jgi:hypothetical protein